MAKIKEAGIRRHLGGGRILTTKEAAKEWNIPKTAIYRLVRSGRLRPFIGTKEWRFLDTDINEALERL